MDRRSRENIMATVEETSISVTDVYHQAAGIAQEFDKLITAYGHDAVAHLMPKVIRALEQLEALAGRYENETVEINQLRFNLEKLENQKAEKAQERARFEHELEQIEDTWQKEVKELLSSNSKLVEENRRLRTNIENHKEAAVAEISEVQKKTEEQEIKVLIKLKETVDKQREDLRILRRELNQKAVDCEALQDQVERIAKVNVELRRKHATQKKQANVLLEEKADLEVALADKEDQLSSIQSRLKEQESFDSAKDAASKASGQKQDEGATLMELRHVLMERNELKTKLIEVEEELAHYRPKESEVEMKDVIDDDKNSDYRGEEVTVYGPIDKEPDYKINPKKNSGIRKLFGFLFDANPSRDRSKSSVTK